MSWKKIKLASLLTARPKSLNPANFPSEVFELYSIPGFDRRHPDIVSGSEIGSAKQILYPGDVLLSKIVPHIRRCWIVGKASPEQRQIGSGEWMVFRSELVDSNYLSKVLVGDEFHLAFMSTVAGVGGSLLRARPAAVAEIEIPLPPLDEQKRIAAVLDKADTLRRQRQESLQLTEKLLQSVFIDMFGDPQTNPKSWPEITVGEILCDGPQNGLYQPRSDYGSGTRILRIDGFYDGTVVDGEKLKRLRLSPGSEQVYLLREGDIVVNRVNSLEFLGKSAVIPKFSEPVVFESNIMRMGINKDRILPRFLIAVLQTPHIRSQISSCAKKAVNQASINQTDVKGLRIFEPPISLQQQCVRRIEKLVRFQKNGTDQAVTATAFFSSLQQRAFRGELGLRRLVLDPPVDPPPAPASKKQAKTWREPAGRH